MTSLIMQLSPVHFETSHPISKMIFWGELGHLENCKNSAV